jgi:squalene cyclase
MLRYAEHRHELNDGRVILQNRAIAKSTATDDRLKAWGLYDTNSGPHARDATRHAITALRRARDKPKFRDEMWAYVP